MSHTGEVYGIGGLIFNAMKDPGLRSAAVTVLEQRVATVDNAARAH
jgi:hypothetical protein